MRILVFSNLTPYVPGGAERQVRLLVEGWAAAGHQVSVAGSALPRRDFATAAGSISLFPVPVYKRAGRAGRALSYFTSVCRVLLARRDHCDLVYCRFLTDSALSVALLKRAGIVHRPLVACPASSGKRGDAAFLRNLPGTRRLAALLSSQCDAINLISRAIGEELQELGVTPGRVTSINNGVLRPPAPAPLPPSPPLRLVFVGGLREQKAVNILVNAVATVRLQGIDVSLDLVGDGPLRSALTHQVDSLGLHHVVRFHGVLAAEGVAARIRDAHVLVLPSRWEGMSNAGLEALAQGRPVILSQCGGLDDFITSETGWTVPADDSDALRDAIEAASRVGTAGLRHMADAAYALAARHFDVETAVQQHLELFLELTGDTN